MKTKNLKNAAEAAELLQSGGLVAVPTETVYGLAGNGLDSAVVENIYAVKGRPEQKPLSLMVPGPEALDRYSAAVPGAARYLAERFWPGPLTLVLPARDDIPAVVLAGGKTVGLRCPDHPLTLELLRALDIPLAAPSANPSGAASPKTAEEVLAYFDGRIDAVLDGGPCGLGRESTILDLSTVPYRILRQGALAEAQLLEALGDSVKIIGITGGSGSGKTTALKVLEGFGALILDCDAIYHELTVDCAPMREALIARFGDVYDGTVLNRKKLGGIVFSDPAALADLNAITWRHVSQALDQRLTDFALRGGTLAAIDAIGLLEIPQARRSLVNVAVTAPLAQRVARLMEREGISEDYARARITAQHSDAYFAEHCDGVLHNDGTKEEFQQQCLEYFREVLKNGCEKGKH